MSEVNETYIVLVFDLTMGNLSFKFPQNEPKPRESLFILSISSNTKTESKLQFSVEWKYNSPSRSNFVKLKKNSQSIVNTLDIKLRNETYASWTT